MTWLEIGLSVYLGLYIALAIVVFSFGNGSEWKDIFIWVIACVFWPFLGLGSVFMALFEKIKNLKENKPKT